MSENGQDNGGGNGHGDPNDLTIAVETARRGFRRDVEVLVRMLDAGTIFIPLLHSVPDVEHGEELEVEEGFRLSPQMLVDEDGKLYCALFTRAELLEPLVDQLGWETDGEALEYATVPARVALEMALEVVDEEHVLGVVLNPLDDSELMLRRTELASILGGYGGAARWLRQHHPGAGLRGDAHRRAGRTAARGAGGGHRGVPCQDGRR